MGFYREQVLPRLIDRALAGDECDLLRQQATEGLSGTVLEVGFGSGRNLPFLPSTVEHLIAIDPARVGRRLARDRLEASPVPVEFVELRDGHLPLADDAVDAVLSTWTLCTIADLRGALGEMARVLAPGGRLHFLEHGLADDPAVVRWQRRLDPLWGRVAGGCHLDRAIDRELRAAGFALDALETFFMSGPRIGSFLYSGRARPTGR